MEELTITQIQELMSAGGLTARELAEFYLERIQQMDKSGPALNSVLEINPEALEIAGALDAERASQGPRGPLHGVPLLLKENIDTGDKMTTSAGSLALEGSIAQQDAFLVAQLRAAGALILGKANLSEWANFRSEHSSSGWSSRGGQTRNPYVLDRNPCGSSSGSAVAVAANLSAAAVGTETDGSVICPSHANGVVGIKPSIGLVSRSGVIPISHSQDTAGPIARCVADAAILLGAMTGADPLDPVTETSPGAVYSDYTQFLKEDGLKGARIGVARNTFGFHPQVDEIMEECIQVLKEQGAEIIDKTNIEEEGFGEAEYEVLLYEFKHDLNRYLANLGDNAPVHDLDELIAFNEEHREKVMPYFGQERLLKAAEKGPLTDNAYLKALYTCRLKFREEGIDAVMAENELDAILAPSGGPAWLTDWVNGDYHGGGSSSPAAVAGYPNITVPAGYVSGLPVGISFFSGAFQEPTIIRLAYAFEQARNARRPPQFLPSVEI